MEEVRSWRRQDYLGIQQHVINCVRSTIERTRAYFVKLNESAHFRILRLIEERPEISQRELARILGVSLGKSHYLLKALLDKGLVKMDNFRRHDNKLAYVYMLTPSGIAAKLNLTREFLNHKEAEFQALHHEIAQLRQELEANVREDAR